MFTGSWDNLLEGRNNKPAVMHGQTSLKVLCCMLTGLWDSLLEGRIKLQKAVSIINQLPQPESWSTFEENAKNFTEESTKSKFKCREGKLGSY